MSTLPSITSTISLALVDRVAISPLGTKIACTKKIANWQQDVFDEPCFIFSAFDPVGHPITDAGKILQLVWHDEDRLILLTQNFHAATQLFYYTYNQKKLFSLTEKISGIKLIQNILNGCLFVVNSGAPYDVCGFDKLYYVSFEDKAVKMLSLPNSVKIIKNIVANQNGDGCFLTTVNINDEIKIYFLKNDTIKEIFIAGLAEFTVMAVEPNNQGLLLEGKCEKARYIQSSIWYYPFDGSLQCLTKAYDYDFHVIGWCPQGILTYFVDELKGQLAWITNTKINHILPPNLSSRIDCSLAKTGAFVFIGQGPEQFPELFYSNGKNHFSQLTQDEKQMTSNTRGVNHCIEWPSKDGLMIQGVMRKPQYFKPDHAYPLVMVLHGGPKDFAENSLLSSYKDYVPYLQLLEQDILILEVNYRGSVGRGQHFLAANVNQLGKGDLFDLESAVDHLVTQGLVDPARVALIGWSQGGYISAFAATRSRYFCAISAGAVISDWKTYYLSTDIPEFVRDYLSGDPWEHPTHYTMSSIISRPPTQKTPMLIFHGGKDKRVPVLSSHQLLEYCQQYQIPLIRFLLPDMGHRITTPMQSKFILQHNLQWLSHFLNE